MHPLAPGPENKKDYQKAGGKGVGWEVVVDEIEIEFPHRIVGPIRWLEDGILRVGRKVQSTPPVWCVQMQGALPARAQIIASLIAPARLARILL